MNFTNALQCQVLPQEPDKVLFNWFDIIESGEFCSCCLRNGQTLPIPGYSRGSDAGAGTSDFYVCCPRAFYRIQMKYTSALEDLI